MSARRPDAFGSRHAELDRLRGELAAAQEREARVRALADRTLTLGGPDCDAWVNLASLRAALAGPAKSSDHCAELAIRAGEDRRCLLAIGHAGTHQYDQRGSS